MLGNAVGTARPYTETQERFERSEGEHAKFMKAATKEENLKE
jgi:hypothetical protein